MSYSLFGSTFKSDFHSSYISKKIFNTCLKHLVPVNCFQNKKSCFFIVCYHLFSLVWKYIRGFLRKNRFRHSFKYHFIVFHKYAIRFHLVQTVNNDISVTVLVRVKSVRYRPLFMLQTIQLSNFAAIQS